MIRFEVRKNWQDKDVAIRMARLVTGDGHNDCGPARPPFLKDNGSWQLDCGNDWFLRRVQELPNGNIEYTLSYRYTTADRQKMLDGLIPFLHFIFDPNA